jgi:holo-[acyl-carrier protein] synthase
MILGLGTDIVDCDRIREALERHGDRFEQRIFTNDERAYCRRMADPTPHFAARFAAKEAARKAMAYGPDLNWQDVEVIRDPNGPVELQFHGVAAEVAEGMGVVRVFLSVSHERSAAVATVVLEG